MKRKSLFGPLLLIALGLVLLLAQLRPEVSPLRLFANHWPWILVAWGGFRLLEYITALVFRRPVPRELGLGAVLLTILLCLIGSAAHSRQQGGGWHVLRLDRTLSGRGSSAFTTPAKSPNHTFRDEVGLTATVLGWDNEPSPHCSSRREI